MFLVLRRSFSKSQKNTFCLGWQKLFHSHLKTWGTCLCPMRNLYAFDAEKVPQSVHHTSSCSDNGKWSLKDWRICNCWKASVDRGRLKRSWVNCWEKNLHAVIALFFAKENNSGYSSFKGCWIHLSDQNKQDWPFWTWTVEKDLKQSSNFRMSLNQKEPFLMWLGNFPFE